MVTAKVTTIFYTILARKCRMFVALPKNILTLIPAGWGWSQVRLIRLKPGLSILKFALPEFRMQSWYDSATWTRDNQNYRITSNNLRTFELACRPDVIRSSKCSTTQHRAARISNWRCFARRHSGRSMKTNAQCKVRLYLRSQSCWFRNM